LIGFLGGTFDPIHNGHLHAARAAAAALELEWVGLILAARPHLRVARAAVEHRWEMLQLAVRGDALLRADAREMHRDAISYTVDTLHELRVEHGSAVPLVWLVGWDAYRALATWHRWDELIDLAHLGVLLRPGVTTSLAPPVAEFTATHCVSELACLRARPAGYVTFVTASMLPISATEVRARIARGESADDLLPPAVSTYIRAHDLYGGSPA
jgi:nicotinate-nucleotide adenylyltransferase